jgi:neutral ceramidase
VIHGQEGDEMKSSNIKCRKFVRLALLLCLALNLVRVTSAELRAGASRVEITPPLASGSEGPTGKYDHEHLYVRAVVIDNGQTRAALIGADQSNMPEGIWSEAAKQIAKDLDCPVANILMSATTRTVPAFPSVRQRGRLRQVLDFLTLSSVS